MIKYSRKSTYKVQIKYKRADTKRKESGEHNVHNIKYIKYKRPKRAETKRKESGEHIVHNIKYVKYKAYKAQYKV